MRDAGSTMLVNQQARPETLRSESPGIAFLPKSSLTSDTLTALTLLEIFALGAAKGKLRVLSKFLIVLCPGNLAAKVFLLFVTIFEILEFFLSFKTKVIGPGQNLL